MGVTVNNEYFWDWQKLVEFNGEQRTSLIQENQLHPTLPTSEEYKQHLNLYLNKAHDHSSISLSLNNKETKYLFKQAIGTRG